MNRQLHSDGELINGLQNGDKMLFNELFQVYYSRLCSYALSIVKYTSVAEEVVQETFVKLWENHTSIQIKVSLRLYLVRCVHNNCINFLKSMDARHGMNEEYKKEITYHAQLFLLNFSEDMLDNIIYEEMEQQLRQLMDELPDQCKKVFYLSRYENLTYNEIGEKLGLSVNTVKTQMQRAFSKLKPAFKDFREK